MNWSHDVFTHRETRLRENSHHFFQIIGKLRSREEKSKCISGYIYKKKETRGKDAVASPSFEKILKNCLESFWCWWKKETMRIRLRLTQMFPLFLSLPSPLIPLYVYLPSFSCRLLLIINWDSTRPNLAYHLKILGLLPHQLYGKGKSDTINTGIIKTFENIKRVALWLAQTSSFFSFP